MPVSALTIHNSASVFTLQAASSMTPNNRNLDMNQCSESRDAGLVSSMIKRMARLNL